ncbi:hypothetical protein D3C75_1257320 [compost metagenome]
MFQRRYFPPGLQRFSLQSRRSGNHRHSLLGLLLLLRQCSCGHIYSLGVSIPYLGGLNTGQLIEDLPRILPADVHLLSLGRLFLPLSRQCA